MNVEVDVSEVREYAKELTDIPGELSRHAVPALKKGAQNIKTTMQADLRQSGNKGFRHVASTVNYDEVAVSGAGYEVEIGPDKPSGALANIAYFGSWKGGGTVRDPREALEEEIPAFEKAVDDLIDGLFR